MNALINSICTDVKDWVWWTHRRNALDVMLEQSSVSCRLSLERAIANTLWSDVYVDIESAMEEHNPW